MALWLARRRVGLIHRAYLLAGAVAEAIGRRQDRAYDRLVDLERRLP